MSKEHSADPFSTFLNATNRQPTTEGPAPAGGQSTSPLPPAAMAVLGALRGRPHTPLGELRLTLRLTTLQIAEAVSMLRRLELVEIRQDGTDDEIELTATGQALIEAQ